MTENPLAFLSLVKVLENAVGHKTKYSQLEPFACATMSDGRPAIIPIQTAGKTIAHHVGLSNFSFIISVTTQGPSTAGHIELRYGSPEVFVELACDICMYKDAVLATLCHEVAHKFLHVNGIRHGTMQVEQEFLTDVATVYLGMGKIMLNGCECQRSYTQTESGKTTTTTHTLRTGYISRECFAFVYRLICEMRQIPREQFLSGLSEPARNAVFASERQYAEWFLPQFHSPSGIHELGKTLQEQVLEGQTRSARHDYLLRRANDSIDNAEMCVRASHKPLLEAARRVTELNRGNSNPHLRYLNCIETREAVSDLVGKSKGKLEEFELGWDRIDAVSELAQASHPESEIVECPIDQTKLRVPSGRNRLLVTCPACKYKFIACTAVEEEKQSSGPSRSSQESKKGLLQSLKAAFGRH